MGAFVLLVEDETLLQMAVQFALEEAGYQVICCATGTAAIEELDRDAERFKALVTDIRLGNGPDGWQVARHARELVSGIPVVYTTADGAADWTAQGVPESILIGKPFADSQVIVAVGQLINAASGLPNKA